MQPPQFCRDWYNGRCTRTRCRFLHEIPNIKGERAPDSSTLKPPPTKGERAPDSFYLPVTIADHIKVKLRDGFVVHDVTTGFESRWVNIVDVHPQTQESAIRRLLEPFGQLDELFVSDRAHGVKQLTVRAQFSTTAQAMQASVALHGSHFKGRRLTAKLSMKTTACSSTVLKDTSVRITWSAPQRIGYAGYATLDEAKSVIAAANGFVMKNNVLHAALYEGLPAVGAYNVMFSHLPADAVRKDLEQFGGTAESIMFERPNYQSLDGARLAVLRALRSCGNLTKFDLHLPITGGSVLVWAAFESHAEASYARDHLDRQNPRVMGGKVFISARHTQSLGFRFALAKYNMLKGEIAYLRQSWWTRFHHDVHLSERFASPEGPVFINISGENVSNLGIAKAQFEQLQRGEVVAFEKRPVWDRFFAQPDGQSFLREVERRHSGIGIRTCMGKIQLLGPMAQRQLARRDIMARFQELQSRQWWQVPLSGKVVGAFVSKDLWTLEKSVGKENCYALLTPPAMLRIRGNEQVYRIACEAVEKVQIRHTGSAASTQRSVCPVCFSEASLPVRLSCGHSWCKSCLEGYLVSAIENKGFPLTCLGADASCAERISLVRARKILSGDDFAALCDAAFWSHVHARTEEFRHCPTPDCAQVYRAAPDAGVILQCPSCLVRICSGCDAEAHDGLTCAEKDEAEDKLFHEWAATHDVKNCPGCKTPIERSEGCNHMTCIRCQTHICWECLATFPKGDGIYKHMRQEHGGIGLEVPL